MGIDVHLTGIKSKGTKAYDALRLVGLICSVGRCMMTDCRSHIYQLELSLPLWGRGVADVPVFIASVSVSVSSFSFSFVHVQHGGGGLAATSGVGSLYEQSNTREEVG
jgi:hypothetical protein